MFGGCSLTRDIIIISRRKKIKKFKEVYSDLPRNDFVDAFIIADHLKFGRINKEVYMGVPLRSAESPDKS